LFDFDDTLADSTTRRMYFDVLQPVGARDAAFADILFRTSGRRREVIVAVLARFGCRFRAVRSDGNDSVHIDSPFIEELTHADLGVSSGVPAARSGQGRTKISLGRERLAAPERACPKGVAMVGNGRRDWQAARALGCRFMGVRSDDGNDFDPHGAAMLEEPGELLEAQDVRR
jgi:phosphoglycolate phosphatase-like HAD superfamily hydrolase